MIINTLYFNYSKMPSRTNKFCTPAKMSCTVSWSNQTVIIFNWSTLLVWKRFLTLLGGFIHFHEFSRWSEGVNIGRVELLESTSQNSNSWCNITSFNSSMFMIAIKMPVRIINFCVENETAKQCGDVPGQWPNKIENHEFQSQPMKCKPPNV